MPPPLSTTSLPLDFDYSPRDLLALPLSFTLALLDRRSMDESGSSRTPHYWVFHYSPAPKPPEGNENVPSLIKGLQARQGMPPKGPALGRKRHRMEKRSLEKRKKREQCIFLRSTSAPSGSIAAICKRNHSINPKCCVGSILPHGQSRARNCVQFIRVKAPAPCPFVSRILPQRP